MVDKEIRIRSLENMLEGYRAGSILSKRNHVFFRRKIEEVQEELDELRRETSP